MILTTESMADLVDATGDCWLWLGRVRDDGRSGLGL